MARAVEPPRAQGMRTSCGNLYVAGTGLVHERRGHDMAAAGDGMVASAKLRPALSDANRVRARCHNGAVVPTELCVSAEP